jgi:hypothetical protein
MKRALLISLVAGLLVPAAAGAATRTKVTFVGYVPLLEGGFYGTVESPKKRCKDGRKVIVYEKDPKVKVGTDLAELTMDPIYSWFVEDGTPTGGDYYAKVRRTQRCQGDKSNVFDLD